MSDSTTEMAENSHVGGPYCLCEGCGGPDRLVREQAAMGEAQRLADPDVAEAQKSA